MLVTQVCRDKNLSSSVVLARRWGGGDFSECHVLYVYWLSRWLSGVQDPVLVHSFVRTHLCVCVCERGTERERQQEVGGRGCMYIETNQLLLKEHNFSLYYACVFLYLLSS